MAPAEEVVGIVVVVVEDAQLRVHGPLRPSRHALPGRDADDAVPGLGPVQRGGRRALHHLDRLNVFGIEVVDARGGLAARADRQGGPIVPRPRLYLGTVHVVRWLVAQREARETANPNPDAGSDAAAGLEHLHARRPAREEVGEVGRLRLLHDILCLDHRHRVREFAPPLLARGGHGHDVERDRGLREREVRGCHRALTHRDRLTLRPVADGRHPDQPVSYGDRWQTVASRGVREGRAVGVGQQNPDPGQGSSRRPVRYTARDRSHALLRPARSGDDAE